MNDMSNRNSQVEDILRLCYDKVESTWNNLYITTLEGKNYIVDNENTIKFGPTQKNIISVWLNKIAVGTDGDWQIYNTVGKVVRKTESQYCSLSKTGGNCWLVRSEYCEGYGLINQFGNQILPSVYEYIYFCGTYGDKVFYKAKVSEDGSGLRGWRDPKLNQIESMGRIIANRDVTMVDCYEAYETRNSTIDIVVTEVKKEIEGTIGIGDFWYSGRGKVNKKYSLRNNGEIVSKEYDDISEEYALSKLGLFRTYNIVAGTRDKVYNTGIIDSNGRELVECKYTSANCVGKDMFIVGNHYGYGVVKGGVETTPCEYTSQFVYTDGAPIQALIGLTKTVHFVGNDGRAYKNITEAFPIYRSTIDPEIFLMCLYGAWIYINKNFKMLDSISNPEIANRLNWVKLSN